MTGEDLGYKPNVFEKAKFDYSLLGMSLSEAFKTDEVKSAAESKSISIMIVTTAFLIFTEGLMNLKTCH